MHQKTKSLNIVNLLALAVMVLHSSCIFASKREVEKSVTIKGIVYEYWQGWYSNGKPWYEQYWRNGKKALTHKNYFEGGGLQSITTYKKGYLHGPMTNFYKSGKKSVVSNYIEEALEGSRVEYFESGKIKQQSTYKNGLYNGAYKEFYENGKLKSEGFFANGIPKGAFMAFDAKGSATPSSNIVEGRTQLPHPKNVGKKLFFHFSMGSHLEGFDFNLKVWPDGRARFVKMTHISKRAKKTDKTSGLEVDQIYYDSYDQISDFQLRPKDLKALTAKLMDLNVFGLNHTYSDPFIEDGSQWEFKVSLDGKKKSVFCSNKFPSELKKLRTFLEEIILSQYSLELIASRTINNTDASRNNKLPQQ
jgi:hypothetical protein